jgi:hypothetical protein
MNSFRTPRPTKWPQRGGGPTTSSTKTNRKPWNWRGRTTSEHHKEDGVISSFRALGPTRWPWIGGPITLNTKTNKITMKKKNANNFKGLQDQQKNC